MTEFIFILTTINDRIIIELARFNRQTFLAYTQLKINHSSHEVPINKIASLFYKKSEGPYARGAFGSQQRNQKEVNNLPEEGIGN